MPKRYTIEDFWARVDRDGDDGCWNWTGTMMRGYPIFGRIPGSRSLRRAHRFSYEEFVAAIEDDTAHVHHQCRNTRCVNPEHLELLEPATHRREHVEAACPLGHDVANLYYSGAGKRRQRYCRECQRLSAQRKWRAAKIPCVRCGTLRSSPAETARSRKITGSRDTGLCRACWFDERKRQGSPELPVELMEAAA